MLGDCLDRSELNRLAVNTIRFLAVDAVQKANSGHPGMPMGMADCAFVLWSEYLRFNPEDPEWPNRDRFILSAGHGSMLLYALLYLSGYDVTLDDLKQFRQWASRTPGHPERGCLPGVETTTGPLGQGFANGVGMALAAKIAAERFNGDDFRLVDHRIYGIVSDGDLMEGVASEAASLAGHLQLGNIVYLYDDNRITIEGSTRLAYSEDVEKRFRAYGWHTVSIDGHHLDEISRAIKEGVTEADRPTLILARTHIAYGSPKKQDDASSHGAPIGEEEVRKTKKNLGWPPEPAFYVPDEVRAVFKKRVDFLKTEYDAWQTRFKAWQERHPDLYTAWSKQWMKVIPNDLEQKLLANLTEKPDATRNIGGKILQKASAMIPSLYGGSADLAPSTKTLIDSAGSIGPKTYSGRNLHFGVREHGMGSVMNGMALYGGFIPYGSTFLVFSDYMRPAIRLAALMELQVIYVFTHDSLFVGEDGPTHQPVEHLAALRTIPNLTVIRPADGLETAMAWAYALRKNDGPTALCLTRQSVPVLSRPEGFDAREILNGGYVLSRENHPFPDVVLAASGSEVSIALECKNILKESGRFVRVVSVPSFELFFDKPASYRNSVIPEEGIPVVVVEAGISQGWHCVSRSPMLNISMDRFGSSAPYEVLAEKFGFTGESIAARVSAWLDSL